MAQKAAMEASEAGRVLQSQRQPKEEVESVEPAPQSDVPRPAPRNDPRDMAMQEILESRKEQAEEVTEPPVEAAPEPAEATVEAPQAVEPAPEAPKTVKVKVDGEEFDVAQAEIDEAGGVPQYRIMRAMENRLKKANETVNETKRNQMALVQYLQQQAYLQQQPKETPEQFMASKIDVIRYGTPEESAAALREVMERSNPRIDQQAIETRTVERMRQSLAVEEFRKEFPEVVANPILMKAATTLENERIAQIMQRGETPQWSSLYRQLGNELRSVLGRPSQSVQPPAQTQEQTGTPSQPDREARKASNVVSLPQAGSRAALPEEPKPKSREDILNEMKKSRGIPTG